MAAVKYTTIDCMYMPPRIYAVLNLKNETIDLLVPWRVEIGTYNGLEHDALQVESKAAHNCRKGTQ